MEDMTQPEISEIAYERLAGYRFARRYVEGKDVAEICLGKAGYGTHVLAGSAESVTVFDCSPDVPEKDPVPDASHVRTGPMPCPDGSFGTTVAFGVIEKLAEPETLVTEAKRILDDGLFILSTPDKRLHSNERNHRDPENKSALYVPEFRELLERHFGHVEIFRLGSVAGGVVLPEGGLSTARIETASPSSLSFDAGPPKMLSVLAVCSDSEIVQKEGRRPYLLLDRERSVFEQAEERREDVELLREGIRRMQETEVQAFEEALQLHGGENLSLREEIRRHKAQIRHLRERNEKLQQQAANADELRGRLNGIEGSRAWRLLSLYRNLKSRLGL